MDVSSKYEIVEKIINSDNDVILNEIKYLLDASASDFWHDLPEEIKSSLKEAEAQLDRGESISHKKIMDEVQQRFFKK